MSELLSVFRCEQWPLWVAGAHAMSPLVTHASQIRCSLSSDGEVMLPELHIALHASSVLHMSHQSQLCSFHTCCRFKVSMQAGLQMICTCQSACQMPHCPWSIHADAYPPTTTWKETTAAMASMHVCKVNCPCPHCPL